jgi:hypothetical protein
MRRWNKSRIWIGIHAAIVGVLLTSQFHLYLAESLHHHDEESPQTCTIKHRQGSYLHSIPDVSPVCPLCQIARNGAIRPSVNIPLRRTDVPAAMPIKVNSQGHSACLASSLQSRAPPLS